MGLQQSNIARQTQMSLTDLKLDMFFFEFGILSDNSSSQLRPSDYYDNILHSMVQSRSPIHNILDSPVLNTLCFRKMYTHF